MENRRNNTRRDGGNRTRKSDDFRERKNSYGSKSFKGNDDKKYGSKTSFSERRKPSYKKEESYESTWFDADSDEVKSFSKSSYKGGKENRDYKDRKPSSGSFRGKGSDRGYGKDFSSKNKSEHKGWKSYDEEDSFERRPRRTNDRKNDKYNNKGKRTRFDYDDETNFYETRPYGKSYRQTPKPEKKAEDGTRLNKYIANAGICSRREADVLIASGVVSVNGEIVTQMGYKVKPDDVVNYGGERLMSEKKRYVLLNKPKGYITTSDDPQDRKTVMMLVENACKERIYPVGRLDRNTTGVLLFTNDGDMAKKLTHPSTGARKIYHVELDKNLTHADMQQMREGLMLEDGEIRVDDVQYVGNGEKRNVVGVVLHSGRNRIVRRIFEAMGYEVCKLDRVLFAELTKKDLPRGHWRVLTDKEVSFLKML